MNYKIHISGYVSRTDQLLVSFSSDETKCDAKDYQSLAFNLSRFDGQDMSDVLKQIARQAPNICNQIKKEEENKDITALGEEFKPLVGQSFEYHHDDLFDPAELDASKTHGSAVAPEAIDSEEL